MNLRKTNRKKMTVDKRKKLERKKKEKKTIAISLSFKTHLTLKNSDKRPQDKNRMRRMSKDRRVS